MSDIITLLLKRVKHILGELSRGNRVLLENPTTMNLMKVNKRTATSQPYLHMESSYIFIYQCTLIIRPTLLLTIFLRSQKFYFHIEDAVSSIGFVKKYRISTVGRSIPHIRELLRLNNNIQLGQRLMKTYKNSLIVHAYRKLYQY
jgi:hypothetical protein